MNGAPWLTPLIVATGIAAIGWMVRYILTSITDKLEDLEGTFIRVTGDLTRELTALAQKMIDVDRRVVRIESWKELFTFPERNPRDKP